MTTSLNEEPRDDLPMGGHQPGCPKTSHVVHTEYHRSDLTFLECTDCGAIFLRKADHQ